MVYAESRELREQTHTQRSLSRISSSSSGVQVHLLLIAAINFNIAEAALLQGKTTSKEKKVLKRWDEEREKVRKMEKLFFDEWEGGELVWLGNLF